jgi:hypothetical protein
MFHPLGCLSADGRLGLRGPARAWHTRRTPAAWRAPEDAPVPEGWELDVGTGLLRRAGNGSGAG